MYKLAIAAVFLFACGSDDKKVDAAVSVRDAPIDTPSTFQDAPAGTFPLKVKNYLAWCSVTVNGGTASPAAMQTVNVLPGTIQLSAVALTGFRLGTTPWHDTAGDGGGGEQGTVTGTGQTASSATTIVVGSAAACAWVCCEFAAGGGCPVTDQCP